ncbi:MAG: hypothetical protein RL681_145 [Candidatus Parcubacteria bacterium]|jgi:hypothetical protein
MTRRQFIPLLLAVCAVLAIGASFWGPPLIWADAPANVDQVHYRWRNDDGSESTATFQGAVDAARPVLKSTPLRLRFEVSNDGGSSSTVPFIKQVQRGSVAMDWGDEQASVTLSPRMDPSRTIVWGGMMQGGGRGPLSDPNVTRVGFDLISSSTIRFNRLNTPEEQVVVDWQAVEFYDGARVQRGTAILGNSDTDMNVTIPAAVDLSQAFVLASVTTDACCGTASRAYDRRWGARIRLTSPTNLEISRTAGGSQLYVYWQVVEMDGVTVQRGLTSFSTSQATLTSTIAAVNASSSFLLFNWRFTDPTEAGFEGRYMTRGHVRDNTTIEFNRERSGYAEDLSWEVVTMRNATVIQGSIAQTPTETDDVINVTLSPSVDMNRTFVFVSDSGGYLDEQNLDSTSWTGRITSGSNLRLERWQAIDVFVTSTVDWQVVTFSTTTQRIARIIPQLQYAAKTAACSATASSSWVAVPTTVTTQHWQMVASSNLTDNATTTNVSVDGGLPDEAASFVPGYVKEASSTAPKITFSSDSFTEIEYSVQATTNAVNNQTYCFRLVDDSADLNAYTVYPEATVVLTIGSASSTLISTIFDTQSASGSALNSLLWQGSQPADTGVKFQLAVSSASSGPWSFKGPSCTTDTNDVYNPGAPGTALKITPSCTYDSRYFRYKAILESDLAQSQTPRVDDIIINWSP